MLSASHRRPHFFAVTSFKIALFEHPHSLRLLKAGVRHVYPAILRLELIEERL
jgi:hypothetical protein